MSNDVMKTEVEYEVTGVTDVADTSAADRRHQMALKLALLKQIMERRQRAANAESRLSKKKAKNRIKGRMAKESRKRNRGR